MKRNVFILMSVMLLLAGCGKGQKFTVQGTLESAKIPAVESVAIEYEMMEAPLQAAVKDQAFSFKGRVQKPIIARLHPLGTEKRGHRFFILEKGDITFDGGLAVGTPLNDTTAAFIHKIAETAKQYKGQKKAQNDAIEQVFSSFISRHADDPCAVFALLYADRRFPSDTILKFIASTSPAIQNDGEIRALKTRTKMRF